MAYHWVPSPQAIPISANLNLNPYPQPVLHRLHGQTQHNPHVAGDDRQEGAPLPTGTVITEGEMQYLRQIDAPNYNAAYYHFPPQPYQYPMEIPHVHMHRDVGVAEAAPEQAQHFAPVQDNHDVIYDNGAHLPVADPNEAFPGVQPHTAHQEKCRALTNHNRQLDYQQPK